MALKGLIFPYIQPQKFFPREQIVPEQYNTVHVDSTFFQNTIAYFQRRNKFRGDNAAYFTINQMSDIVTIVYHFPASNYEGTKLEILYPDNTKVEVPRIFRDTTIRDGDLYEDGSQLGYQQWKFRLKDIVGAIEGKFFYLLTIEYGDTTTEEFISEPNWAKTTYSKSLYFEYSHRVNKYNVFFDMNPQFAKRLPAVLLPSKPIYEDEVYRNQETDLTILSSDSYRVFDCIVGQNGGISPYDIDKLRVALQCSELKIDGKGFVRDGDIEITPLPSNPLAKMTFQVNEAESRYSAEFIRVDPIEVMTLGNFPYVLDALSFDGDMYINFLATRTNQMQEILDISMEDDFVGFIEGIAISLGLTGTFFENSGKLYYSSGSGEYYYRLNYSKLDTCREVYYTTTALDKTIDVTVRQLDAVGKTVLSIARDSITTENTVIADYLPYTGSSPVSGWGLYGGTYQNPVAPTIDSFLIRIYFSNHQDILQISSNENLITDLQGEDSNILVNFSCTGGDMSSFDLSRHYNSQLTLESISLANMGISAINVGTFAPTVTDGFKNLAFVQLPLNELSDSEQDNFYSTYYDNIADLYPTITTGLLNTQTQTPASAPTAASAADRAALITQGFTLIF